MMWIFPSDLISLEKGFVHINKQLNIVQIPINDKMATYRVCKTYGITNYEFQLHQHHNLYVYISFAPSMCQVLI